MHNFAGLAHFKVSDEVRIGLLLPFFSQRLSGSFAIERVFHSRISDHRHRFFTRMQHICYVEKVWSFTQLQRIYYVRKNWRENESGRFCIRTSMASRAFARQSGDGTLPQLDPCKLSCVAVCMPELRALLRTNAHIERVTISSSADFANSLNSSFDDIMLPKLSTLVVTNYHLGDKKILGAKGSIVQLDISSCFFAGSVLLEIAALCPQLRAAVLSDLSFQGLTDELLNKFTTLCPHIAHLHISKADDVTDAGMLSVVKSLKGLRSLKFTDTSQLTDASLVHIYTHCADTLQTFVFGYNGNNTAFSADTINTLLERCPKLRTVY